jgi:citrate synthase
MTRRGRRLKSDISWNTPDRIVVKGLDLAADILGKVNLGDMAFLELRDRLPSPQESVVFNALLVALVEHGITPSVLASRLTYLGAPESLQGAIAAGLLGVGSLFVGTVEGSAQMLQEALRDGPQNTELRVIARRIVQDFDARKASIPGLGHQLHKREDPRTSRLFAIAAGNGLSGRHVQLMQLIADEFQIRHRRSIPINATGAIGALASELELPWQVCRGLGVISRAIGLTGHLLEEMRQPMAQEIWDRVEAEATEHLSRRPEANSD